jgi:O-antigen/teichoic acid export membrane protein
MMASAGGLGMFGARAAARGEGPLLAGPFIGARLMNALAALALIACVVFLMPNAATGRFILLLSVALIPVALNLDWYFQGKEAMASIGVARIISAAVYFLLAVTLVHTPADLLLVAAGAVAGDTAAALFLAMRFRRRFPAERLRPVFSGWRKLTLGAFPLGAGTLLAQIGVNLPPLVLGILMTNADAGIFSAAGKLVTLLLVVDRVIATLLLPATARSYGRSPEALSEMLNGAVKWMAIVALPVCVGGAVLARRIVPVVFGDAYAAAGDVLSVLIWFLPATLLHTVYTSGLIAAGEEKLYGRIMVIGALIYVCSTFLLTALFGAIGSAAAVVISEAGGVVLMARRSGEFLRLSVPATALKSLAAAAVMCVALLLIGPASLPVLVGSGALVYGVLMLATRAITRTDLDELLRRV